MKHSKLNALGYHYSSCAFTPYTKWWLCNLAKRQAGIIFPSTQRPSRPSQYRSQVAFIKRSTTPRPTLEWLDELLPSSLPFLCQVVLEGEERRGVLLPVLKSITNGISIKRWIVKLKLFELKQLYFSYYTSGASNVGKRAKLEWAVLSNSQSIPH